MKNFAPESIVVLMLTAGVLAFMVSITIDGIGAEVPMTNDKVKIVDNIVTSIIAIISVYVGSKLNTKKD